MAKTGPQNAKFKGSKYVSTKNRNIKGVYCMQSSESVMGIARLLSLEVDMDNGVYIVSTICLLSLVTYELDTTTQY